MENQEEKELNNTFPEVVDVYITLDNGDELRVFKKADPVQMENQEVKETSLEYFYDKVLDAPAFYPERYRAIMDALDEAKKMYEKELKESFEKGYEEGVKYTDK